MWKEIANNVRTFQLDEEPELIHVIKTGFTDEYMVVREDAHETHYGEVEKMSRKAVEEKFKINLSDDDKRQKDCCRM